MSKCIMIAAGGTGGHIYPALAIAQAMQKISPDVKIYFVGTKGGLENKIVPPKGFPVLHLPIGRLNSNVGKLERLLTLFRLPFAFLKSIFLILRYRPQFVLGVGGHASGPLLLMASFLRCRTGIWEPNAMPGMANRWLARFVDECFVVFSETKRLLSGKKFLEIGMPVRAEIEAVGREPKKPSEKFHIFVFGGSQGARSINTAVVEMMLGGKPWSENVELVHQTGGYEIDRVKALYGDQLQNLSVEVKPYIDDMDQRFRWADIVIARSGTGTISELAASGRPAILVPLPTAADNHQQKNAEAFVKLGAAKMILQTELNGVMLREAVKNFEQQPEKLREMGQGASRFHHPGSADKLARHIVERMKDASR